MFLSSAARIEYRKKHRFAIRVAGGEQLAVTVHDAALTDEVKAAFLTHAVDRRVIDMVFQGPRLHQVLRSAACPGGPVRG